MSSCPSCNRATNTEAAVCECGELLRADVTNVGCWETETIFAAPRAVNSYRIAAVATLLVIVSTVIALSWPQLQQRLLGMSESTNDLNNAVPGDWKRTRFTEALIRKKHANFLTLHGYTTGVNGANTKHV